VRAHTPEIGWALLYHRDGLVGGLFEDLERTLCVMSGKDQCLRANERFFRAKRASWRRALLLKSVGSEASVCERGLSVCKRGGDCV
jgi:hypothetical protein